MNFQRSCFGLSRSFGGMLNPRLCSNTGLLIHGDLIRRIFTPSATLWERSEYLTIFSSSRINFPLEQRGVLVKLNKSTKTLSHHRTLSSSSSCLEVPGQSRRILSPISSCLHGVHRGYSMNRNYTSTGLNEPSSGSAPSSAKISNRPDTLPPVDGGVEVIYFRGLPQITVPLPSRREKCRFILKPLTNTVGDLLEMIQHEDKGIDRIIALSQDGVRIAASNTIEMLMEQNFNLVINDTSYLVHTPPQEKPSEEELERLSSVRNLVGQLYAALNVDEHQLRLEREMMAELERLQVELGPLEQKKEELAKLSSKRTNNLTWIGLGLMSVQFGILARLTWWEYSWDIMEPITYFVTYGTAMLAYAYFVITKQDYVLPDVRDRQFLITFHKNARKIGLDVGKYNDLKTKMSKIEGDLQRLRDPLALHLPLKTRSGVMDGSHRLYSTDTSKCIIGKAQQKLQEILQKAQKTSSQPSSSP